VGEAAAEEAIDDIRSQMAGSHMVFIAAGMGGGTGTGAAAVIARAAKELGILTVGVVTKPFQFEGARRMRIAEAGIAELKKVVDTLIVIPNQNLFRIASEKTTFAEAFVLADQVLYSGVACIVDLIIKEGLINLDFADVRTIMSGMGTAMMGTGEASGERRAIIAAEEAISNPLLDDVSLKGAKGLLLSITGGSNLTLYEVDEAASRVRQEVDPDANIIVGATFDEALGDRVRVSIVASGMARLNEGQKTVAEAETWPRATRKGIAIGVPFDPNQQQKPSPVPPSVPISPSANRDEDDVQRRLGDALKEMPGISEPVYGASYSYDQQPPAAPFAPPSPPAQSPAQASRDVWRGPGNVTIEEGLPPQRGGLPPVAPVQADMRAQSAPTAPFVPAPPAEMPRGAQRRMPQVEDFPIVGQRDYRAKTSVAASGGYAPDTPSYGEEIQPRRPGFLERITGRMRRSNDSHEQDWGREHAAEPRAAAQNPAPQAQGPAQNPRQRAAGRVQEEAELPVFFSRERK
jgi:cell division protein FtsZ